MKRSPISLLASVALAACLIFGATSIASASTRHKPLNARTMASSYMKSSLAGDANVSQTALDSAYTGGCSYRSFAASHSVDPTSVVNAACRRAQTVINGQVRSHRMSRSRARSFMSTFRGYCNRFFGPALPPSTPATTAPAPGHGWMGPWSGTATSTPTVPTSTPTMPGPGSGYGGGGW